MKETDLYSEMAKVDSLLMELIDDDPELGEVYAELMDEEPGSVVYLPRAPTAEELARAQELANLRK
jgi:hypothetical protein